MNKKKIPGGIKFLIIIVFIYAFIGVSNLNIFMNALNNFIKLAQNVLPILAFVFIFLVIMNKFINPEKIEKHLGENSGIKGWVYTLIASSLISLPPYILYPILGDLKKKGMKNSLIAGFMYNRNVQLVYIPAMIYYFGLIYTLIFSFYVIIFSILSGFVTGKLSNNQ